MIRKMLNMLLEMNGRRIWALLLCAAMVISVVPSAFAADGEPDAFESSGADASAGNTDPSQQYYILKISTGILPGKYVQYLGVRYVDDQGTERTEYVFPHEGDLGRGYEIANKISGIDKRLKAVEATSGYKPSSDYKDIDGLQSYSTDMYLMQPRYKVVQYLGLDAFMRYDSGALSSGDKCAWTLNDAEFYRVDELKGLAMKGYVSSDYYIRFTGTKLAELKRNEDGTARVRDLSINACDHLYRGDRVTADDLGSAVPAIPAYDNTEMNEYIMELDFADVYEGGFEGLATEYKDKKALKSIVEGVSVRMEYYCVGGGTETVVVPMVVGTLGWAYESGLIQEGDAPTSIIGIAQQGESLILAANLPDLDVSKKPKSFELVRGKYGADQARITTSYDGKRQAERLSKVASETVAIERFAMYAPNTPVGRDDSVPAMLRLVVEPNAKPFLHFNILTHGGANISKESTNFLSYLEQGEENREQKEKTDVFIVQIATCAPQNAGTTEDIRMQLSYRTTGGESKTTDALVLRELSNEFFGYWPGKNGNTASYQSGVSAGSTLTFRVELANVNRFESVTLSVSTAATDDWQMESIAIYHAPEASRRMGRWADLDFSDRVFTRTFDDSPNKRMAWYPNNLDRDTTGENEKQENEDGVDPILSGILLNSSQPSVTIEFGENSKSVIHENKPVDWSDIRYAMSYEEALQDLGFVYRSTTYEVVVTVASDTEAVGDDDCGSNNLFYFKLNFEAGSSGYVLANQQLAGDGFRAGREETFTIVTNEEYGELESVSIIPANDDNTKQDVFDKLNIKKITVTCDVKGGMSKEWRIDEVGWIDIGITEATSKAHLEGEIAKVCRVNSSGYGVEVLVAIQTGEYEVSSESMAKSKEQFRGTVVGTMTYYDTSGVLQKRNIDIVKQMYQYAEKAPVYYDSGKTTLIGGEKASKSDPSFMFRANHTDRFIVKLDDVRTIMSLTINPSAEAATVWNIAEVSIAQITEKGALHLTTDDEYYHTDQKTHLAYSDTVNGYSVLLKNPVNGENVGEQQEVRVDFNANKIDVDTSKSVWTSTITSEPKGFNDTLNLFVYMQSDIYSTPISSDDFNLECNIQYKSRNGDLNSVYTGLMHKDVNNNMFYVRGLKASGLAGLSMLTLKPASLKRINANVGYVVVQHIRSGVVMSTKRFSFNGKPNSLNTTIQRDLTVADTLEKSETQTQIITMFLSSDTPQATLMKGADDIAVAMRYRTLGPDANAVYDSRYYFLSELLTDSGEIKYSTIGPNAVIQLTLHETSVVEVTGLMIAATGTIKAKVDAACVELLDGTGANKGWYSFDEPTELTLTPRSLSASETRITPVIMTFTNVDPPVIVSGGADGGKAAPIRMTVSYTNMNTGGAREYVIDDISKYLVSGSFSVVDSVNNKATIAFYLKDAGQLRSVKLEPHVDDPYGHASWKVSSVAYRASFGGEIRTREVTFGGIAQSVRIGEPLSVNFSEIMLNLDGHFYNELTGVEIHDKTGKNETTGELKDTIELSVRNGQQVTIEVDLIGSLEEYGYKVVVEQNGIVDEEGKFFQTAKEGKAILLNLPKNVSGEDIVYKLTFLSEEDSSVRVYAVITLASDEEEPEESTEPSENPTEPSEPAEPTLPTELTTDPSEEPSEPENGESLRSYHSNQSLSRGFIPPAWL